MSKICQITGKKAQVGNNVSHSKHRTKRTFDVNLFTKKFYYVEEDCWISLRLVPQVSALSIKSVSTPPSSRLLPKGMSIGRTLKL